MLACSKCKVLKPRSEFFKRNDSKRGYKSHCKSCERLYSQQEHVLASHCVSSTKYQKTEKGKIASRASCKRFRQTEAAKKSIIKSRTKYPERRSAQITLWNAVQSGKIVRPDCCSVCGISCVPEGHHPDYSRPLYVIWLCKDCHEAAHHPITSLA